MKGVRFIFLILLLGHKLCAQEYLDSTQSRHSNIVSINLLGDASWVAVSYERLTFINSKFVLSSKIRLGYYEEIDLLFDAWYGYSKPNKYLTIPFHLSCNLGKNKYFFEIGMGAAQLFGNFQNQFLIYPLIGYRYVSIKANKVNFRIFIQIPTSGIISNDFLFIPISFNFGLNLNTIHKSINTD